MKTTYPPAKMDTAHTIVTASVFVLMGLFAYLPLCLDLKPLWGAAAFVAVVIAFSWQMRPARYEISDEGVTIVRAWPFGNIAIPKAEIKDVRPVKLTAKTIRTFGVGGLFGTGGWSWNRDLGNFFVAITNGHKLLLISNGEKFVISPEDPERFVNEVKSAAGVS